MYIRTYTTNVLYMYIRMYTVNGIYVYITFVYYEYTNEFLMNL